MSSSLTAAPPVTATEWEARKRFVGFGHDDVELLRELHLVARAYADEVLEELYARWLSAPELRRFFANDDQLRRVKSLQRRYFVRLTEGDYGADYLADRLGIGVVHRRIGLEPRWYMAAYAIYLQIVLPRVCKAFEYDRRRMHRAITALTTLIALDQELAMVSYYGATT